MEKNVGGVDRIGRFVIGIVAAIAGIAALAGVWSAGALVGGVALLIGIVLLATGATQKCVINDLLGINTLRK